jgi:hypothetical protein
LVEKLRLTQCNIDQAVFFSWSVPSEIIAVVIHIDNCTIGASTIDLVQQLNDQICTHIEITDLGELHWLLGIEVT